jgi:hypothetical protein
VNTTSIRVRVALAKARESQELTREVVDAALANTKARLEAAVAK